ncbi:MAG: nucleoside triphosphate pyrophosphohydrolase [Planctomycetota bacterium]
MSYANPGDEAALMSFGRLLCIMRRLRDPEDGCPWDLQQTFSSITPYTIEEAYEVADAVDRGKLDELPGELGDLLLQVVFLSQIGVEEDRFDIETVIVAICEKMERRHPHIFGDVRADDAITVKANWDAIKEEEKRSAGEAGESLRDDVPRGMPALVRAQKLQRRAAKIGFDWPDADGALRKLDEEVAELSSVSAGDCDALEDELGDVLFSAVNVARKLGLDADAALRRANAKFERRFRTVEASTDVTSATLDEMEVLWRRAKAGETDGLQSGEDTKSK